MKFPQPHLAGETRMTEKNSTVIQAEFGSAVIQDGYVVIEADYIEIPERDTVDERLRKLECRIAELEANK